ncbi:FMN-binding protein [Amnibacterium sp.]|uniref:FMN-binding protein n=1 Tax=Amnibacterium sp. TaxID=1872496 RepID=UPI003F7BEDC8
MRRAPIVITATVLGTAGVLLFKPFDTASVASTSALGSSGAASSGSTGASSGSTGGSSSASSTPSATSTPSSGSSASGSSASSGSYTGAAETTRFGTTQVKVTLAGGKITEVQTVQLNQNDPRSYAISTTAAPMLRTEVLSKQSASVDTISGATYTSLAYEASLQSALDKAGYRAPDGSKASTNVSNIQEGGF